MSVYKSAITRYFLFAGLFILSACKEPETKTTDTVPQVEKSPVIDSTSFFKSTPEAFVPEGLVVFEKSFGDLNKDGLEDCILIVKDTKKENIIVDEYRGELDRNRRGIIILFKRDKGYELALSNTDCFSSENEDGGVYYAPELAVSAEKGNLHVDYAHGRYGYWSYTFRYGNDDFELIGYDDSSNHGPVVNSTTSINFLTRTKIVNANVNAEADSGDEIFEETKSKLVSRELLKLSVIKDFDELRLPE